MRWSVLLAGAAFALGGAAAAAGQAPSQSLAKTRIQDLHYGDVLFQYYIGEDFEALTRLEAYKHWDLMTHHVGEADLLAGGLFLELGIHNEAGRRFETLLGADVPAPVRSRAWFHLGRVWYARGYYDRAVQSLSRIETKFGPETEAEKLHLLANALIHLQRYDEAVRVLEGYQGSAEWVSYAQFNLGVALVRANRLEEASRFLTAAGTVRSEREEVLALRDKANLALGFALLQANQPAPAKVALQRVRLDGPQSTRALLAVGWADAALGQFREALNPWLELRDRNLLDAAVQESYLAVPYAFAQLGANGQAADYYEQALASFAAERGRIDESIVRIREGALLADLLKDEDEGTRKRGWYWQVPALPDAPESRYLYPILAGNDFQEGLKNYRDLGYLGTTLGKWDEDMVVYTDMIEARERAFAERTPRVAALLSSDLPTRHDESRAALESRFNDVVARGDFAELGTPEQRAQWHRIESLEAALAGAPENAETAAMRERLRLVRGVLQWQLVQDFRGRLYHERREMKSLDAALAEMRSRWLRVERANELAPRSTGDFAQRIVDLQARLTALRSRLGESQTALSDQLASIATSELEAQKARLDEYELQARFSLASIYDRAAEPPK
ncbi:MAG: hypothetical protein ABW136_11150 [Steroidobacteraceae bacterium]